VRWRAPDDLATALACFRRAIRAHRRLARLAPRFFDSAVVDRQRREDDARRRWMDLWKPAFLKVYGCPPDPPPPVPDPAQLLPPRTRVAIECELASWELWFGLGDDALRRFRVRRPHACVSLSQLTSVLEIGFAFARLATGVDSPQPQIEPATYTTALADLERIYGNQHSPTTSPNASETNEAPRCELATAESDKSRFQYGKDQPENER